MLKANKSKPIEAKGSTFAIVASHYNVENMSKKRLACGVINQ